MATAQESIEQENATRSGRVLVVDDDSDFTEGLDLLLVPEGYQVVSAHNANEALRVLETFTAEVALIDVRLAGHSGIDLIKRIRDRRPNLLCVMMTAYASTETAIEALQGGAYDYLRKPFSTLDLLATLDRCFGRLDLENAKLTTELKLRDRNLRLEQALRDLTTSEERFRSLVETSPICIKEMDTSGRILSMNQAGVDMMELTDFSEIQNQDYFGFIDAAERDGVKSHFDKVCVGSTREIEVEIEVASGPRLFSTCLAPLYDANGDVKKVMAVTQDITDRKEAAEQLHQAQKMDAIGQLTGGIAHDFNNQLAVVMGNAEIIGTLLPEDHETSDYVEAIVNAAACGAELTHRLLAFSRRQPLRPQATQIVDLVINLRPMLARSLGETIDVEIVADAGLWPVMVDPNQVENAVLNLAINARDAMPDGGRLLISMSNCEIDADTPMEGTSGDASGEYVEISVQDFGTGIDPDFLPHVFEPFYTTKGVGEGSGLGLSMVYGFAKQSGGHVAIESTVDHGTTVKLYLPKVLSDSVQASETGAYTYEPMGHEESVLIVEDDDDVRTLIASQLESLGYAVDAAISGPDAIEKFTSGSRYDLVLSDVVLPGGMSGPEIAAQIRDVDPDAKVLFMSGYSNSGGSNNAILENNSELLTKPFLRTELAQKVRVVLDTAV